MNKIILANKGSDVKQIYKKQKLIITEKIMTEKIQEGLLVYICTNYMVERDEIDLQKSLIDTGIIDSIGLIEISNYIMDTYNIVITEKQINRDNFGSVIRIVSFIEREIAKSA